MTSIREKITVRNQALSGPAFRWELAKQLADTPGRLRGRGLDRWTYRAALYLRRLKQTDQLRAQQADFEVAAACDLMQNEATSQIVKLSILGQLPREETTKRLGVAVETLDFAEALFFEIGELRQALGWMNAHIFVPEARFGSKELAAKLKLAHFGGPLVTRKLLESQECLPEDDVHQMVAPEMLLHSKLHAALEFDLDRGSAVEFAKLYLDYELECRKLKFAQEQFRHQLEQARATQPAEMFGESKSPDAGQADALGQENDHSNQAVA